jgi:3-oxoadipate enol-lactonase
MPALFLLLAPADVSLYHRSDMPRAAVNGIQVYYQVHGQGAAVAFAHGAGGNHMSWWQQVPAFARHYRCVTFDHRGFGFSGDGLDGPGPAAFVDDLRALLDHLGIEQTFLVGQSMGGLTCLGFTLAYPQRVRALVMANTLAGLRRALWQAADDEVRAQAQAAWERRRAGPRRALAFAFSRRHRHLAFLYKQIRLINEEGLQDPSSQEYVQRLRALERDPERAASHEALASIGIPVLFIGGEHDDIMPVPLMEVAVRLIPTARLVVVPGCGHSAYFEAPAVFNRLVLDFFREVA